jgi:MYXO-CTERM domain-containing protein
MTKTIKLLALSATSLLLAAFPAWADLIGSQVTGSLQFTAPPPTGPNYYDPANGYVNGPSGVFPGGSLNSAGTTVAISGSSIEFGFHDGANTDSADFTGSQLTITDIDVGGANPWTMIFTDSAFTSLSKVSDNFINGGLTGVLVGDVLTVNWGGDPNFTGGDFQAVFDVNSNSTAPDGGSTLLLLSLAAIALVWLQRRRVSIAV